MAKCCVCGGDASIRAHGLWWCDEHYEQAGVGAEKLPGEDSRGGGGVNLSVDLGLNWI